VADSSKELINKVNELIKQGWKPQGGISILATVHSGCTQAMIREKP